MQNITGHRQMSPTLSPYAESIKGPPWNMYLCPQKRWHFSRWVFPPMPFITCLIVSAFVSLYSQLTGKATKQPWLRSQNPETTPVKWMWGLYWLQDKAILFLLLPIVFERKSLLSIMLRRFYKPLTFFPNHSCRNVGNVLFTKGKRKIYSCIF